MVLALAGCGEDTKHIVQCIAGCPGDAELLPVVGPPGADGEPGDTGATGEQGIEGVVGITGATGSIGATGPSGPASESGSDCTVVQATDGATIICEDGTIAPINNGTDGESGVIGVIDPCGAQATNGFDEILLRLHSGELFANYYDAARKRSGLVLIHPGSYITTDGTGCEFTVTQDLEVMW